MSDFLTIDVVGANRLRNFDRQPEIVQRILLAKIEAFTDKLARTAGDLMSERLQSKTGRLTSDKIQTEVTQEGSRVTGKVFVAGVPYAKIQEEGGTTRPHEIYPRNGKVLAFIGATGEKVVARSVYHPGGTIQGKHFFKDAYRQMAPEISRGLKKALVDGIRANMRGQS